MKITHLADGTIVAAIAAGIEDQSPEDVPGIKIPDDELPEDFLSTFSLGKYRVDDGKILAVKGFRKPSKQGLLKEITRSV